MTRVYVIVEGLAERRFVDGPLAEALLPNQVYLKGIVLGVAGHKGGRTNHARVQKDLIRQLKQDTRAYCSTMIDFYGLGKGFPGTPPAHLNSLQKVEHIERAMKEDICGRIPEFRPDKRLIPYLSLHEYEALLFSDPVAFAVALGQPNLSFQFQVVRSVFSTPEDINDDVATAPSKRVAAIYPAYRKVIEGTIAARAVGVNKMQQECPHFREWLERLRTLPAL